MDLISAKSNSSILSEVSHTLSLSAKLRRLKIEESLLLQSINKSVPDCSQTESEVDTTNYLKFSEFKAFSAKIKNSYKEIKVKFQDIKSTTSSQEMLKSVGKYKVIDTHLNLIVSNSSLRRNYS